jgi:hypothetical protein
MKEMNLPMAKVRFVLKADELVKEGDYFQLSSYLGHRDIVWGLSEYLWVIIEEPKDIRCEVIVIPAAFEEHSANLGA